VIFFLLSIPFGVQAESQVEIPTTIQVVDEDGRTHVSTNTPPRLPEVRTTPHVIPPLCAGILNAPHKYVPPLSIPADHPLRTRIESQRAVLSSLVAQFSFAPELSEAQGIALKESLSEFGADVLSTSTPLTCLSLLQGYREEESMNRRQMIAHLSDVARGLQYGLRSLSREYPEAPQGAVEALYAGDMLLSQRSSITSLTLTEGSLRMHVLFPVRMFWGSHATATVIIFSDERVVRAHTPWWSIFGKHTYSKTQERLSALLPQQPSFEGMYLRAKDIIEALPS